MAAAAAAAADAQAAAAAAPSDPVLQYVILRKDLWTDMKWPLGSVVAQACHASTAAMFSFYDDEITAQYVAAENISSMHKVRPITGSRRRAWSWSPQHPVPGSPPPIHQRAAAPSQVVLEVKGEAQLRTLSAKLDEAGVKHKLWVEQPEDYPTCLATKPYHKSEVAQHFKKFQLCKAALGS
jgi:hypothetical protein